MPFSPWISKCFTCLIVFNISKIKPVFMAVSNKKQTLLVVKLMTNIHSQQQGGVRKHTWTHKQVKIAKSVELIEFFL